MRYIQVFALFYTYVPMPSEQLNRCCFLREMLPKYICFLVLAFFEKLLYIIMQWAAVILLTAD